jgi:hypothetical protein
VRSRPFASRTEWLRAESGDEVAAFAGVPPAKASPVIASMAVTIAMIR